MQESLFGYKWINVFTELYMYKNRFLKKKGIKKLLKEKYYCQINWFPFYFPRHKSKNAFFCFHCINKIQIFFPPAWEQVEETTKQNTKQKLTLAKVWVFFFKKYFQLNISNFLDQKFFYISTLGKTHWPIHKNLAPPETLSRHRTGRYGRRFQGNSQLSTVKAGHQQNNTCST